MEFKYPVEVLDWFIGLFSSYDVIVSKTDSGCNVRIFFKSNKSDKVFNFADLRLSIFDDFLAFGCDYLCMDKGFSVPCYTFRDIRFALKKAFIYLDANYLLVRGPEQLRLF